MIRRADTDAGRLPAVSSRGLPAQIADAIVQGITAGAFDPGQRLIETDLARRFAVSRVPLREALRTLEAQGIVARDPHRSVHVVALDEARIDQVCEVRAALETIAARGAVAAYRRDPGRLHGAETAIDDMARAVRRSDWAAVNGADLAFHHELCIASGNDVVLTLWQGLARHVLLIFGRETLSRPARARIVPQHRELLAALLAADDGTLPRLVEHHIMRLRRPSR